MRSASCERARRPGGGRHGRARPIRRRIRPLGRASSSSGFRAHATFVYAVPVPADPRRRAVRVQRHERAWRRGWQGFSLRWFGIALDDPVVLKALTNSFIVAIPNAILATAFGTMAALGLQRVGKRIRIVFDGADLHERHRPRDRHRAVDPRPVRQRLRRRSRPDRRQAQLRPPDDHRGARPVQHQPRAAAGPGPAVGHGPDARSRRAPTCSPRRGGRSARSRSRSCCRRSSPGSCCRSRSASTTT